MISIPKIAGPSAEPEPGRLSAPFNRLDTFGYDAREQSADACAVIDTEAVDDLIAEVGAVATAEMLTVYLLETERRLAILRALPVDRSDAIHLQAHTIKGSSGIFGLPRLAATAGALERSALTVAARDYPLRLEELDAAYAASKHVLSAYLENVLRGVARAAARG